MPPPTSKERWLATFVNTLVFDPAPELRQQVRAPGREQRMVEGEGASLPRKPQSNGPSGKVRTLMLETDPTLRS